MVPSVNDEEETPAAVPDPTAPGPLAGARQSEVRPALESLESLGDGRVVVDQMHELIRSSRFFSEFTVGDVDFLAQSLEAYRAQQGQIIIREGAVDDYMLLVISGHVEIAKRSGESSLKSMMLVGPGATVGEMSMIDGEPRAAFCIAAEPVTVAVLRRDAMVRVMLEQPSVGAKVLIKLVAMLSERLRQAGASLSLYC